MYSRSENKSKKLKYVIGSKSFYKLHNALLYLIEINKYIKSILFLNSTLLQLLDFIVLL